MYDLFTLFLIYLHCLPIQARVDCKIVLLTYRALNGLPHPSSCRGKASARGALLLWSKLQLQIWEAGSIVIFKTFSICYGPGKHSTDFFILFFYGCVFYLIGGLCARPGIPVAKRVLQLPGGTWKDCGTAKLFNII